MLNQVQVLKAIRSAAVPGSTVRQSRRVLQRVAGAWDHPASPQHVSVFVGYAPGEISLVADRRRPVGHRLPLRFYCPCWGVQTDDPAFRALSPLPDDKLPQVDALACLDQEIEDSVRFSVHATLVTQAGDLVGKTPLPGISRGQLRNRRRKKPLRAARVA